MKASETIVSIIYTALGVVAGIFAVYNGIRLDWAETALIVGAVLATVGTTKLFKIIGGIKDEF